MKPVSLEYLLEKTYPEPNSGCWLWSGLHDKNGYGRVSPKKFRLRNTHRLMYFFTYGEFDRSLQVLHKCDNPACINPSHLFLGTNIENVADRQHKFRTVKGKAHYKAKLNDQIIRAIRIEYAKGQKRCVDLAEEYGVSSVMISCITTRKNWKHVI